MKGIQATREQRRQMQRDNAKMPANMTLVPRDKWPAYSGAGHLPIAVWRSRYFLVQVYQEGKPALVRISVSRTTLEGDRWADGITWDELQQVKDEAGYPMHDAVEVFPRATDVVNVANMRHLFVMEEPLKFAWRRGVSGA